MSDVVVTVPINFQIPEAPDLRGLDAWRAEGDAAGEEESGVLWCFTTGGAMPIIQPGERVHVVCEDRLRGYAPLVDLRYRCGRVDLMRRGGAIAITIPEKIVGFRGWRYRWWDRSKEVPFPDWMTADRRHQQGPRKRKHGDQQCDLTKCHGIREAKCHER